MNDDAIWQRQVAERMVVRMLLSELWQRFLLTTDEPILELNEVSQMMLDGLDQLAEQNGGGDVFNATALDDMENFWRNVRSGVARKVATR